MRLRTSRNVQGEPQIPSPSENTAISVCAVLIWPAFGGGGVLCVSPSAYYSAKRAGTFIFRPWAALLRKHPPVCCCCCCLQHAAVAMRAAAHALALACASSSDGAPSSVPFCILLKRARALEANGDCNAIRSSNFRYACPHLKHTAM